MNHLKIDGLEPIPNTDDGIALLKFFCNRCVDMETLDKFLDFIRLARSTGDSFRPITSMGYASFGEATYSCYFIEIMPVPSTGHSGFTSELSRALIVENGEITNVVRPSSVESIRKH